MVGTGSSGFLINEISFKGFFNKYIKFHGFSSREFSCISMLLYEIDSPGDPVKWFWFLFHHWWRQFPCILIRRDKFPKTSFDDFHFHWLQINSIGFHWFFSNRNDTHGFLFNETNFQRNFIQKLFPWNSILQILISWNSNQSKLLFPLFQFEIEFPPHSRWWNWF